MSCFTASYFSSRPTAATNSSKLLCAIPSTAGQSRPKFLAMSGVPSPSGAAETRCKSAGSMPRLRSKLLCGHRKEPWGISPPDRSSFCEILCAVPRCPPAARPVLRPLPALRVRRPDSKYIYIDAVRRQSVTRQTLLRYTLNSACVNTLISGNLWKNNATFAPVGERGRGSSRFPWTLRGVPVKFSLTRSRSWLPRQTASVRDPIDFLRFTS